MTMARTMFRMGFAAEPWFGLRGDYASPIDFTAPPGIQYAPMPNWIPEQGAPAPQHRGIERADLVGPLTVNMPREEIERGNGHLLRRQPVPGGWTGTFPYVVKVEDKGEYLVYADGTAQYIEYHTGRVFAPKRIQGVR